MALLGVFLTGAFVAFYSGASSPDYRALWWATLPAAILHGYIGLRYVSTVRHWTRWVATGITFVALSSFFELWTRAFR
ncbi:MAG: hypothetical protein QM784_10075 [Polyangiaceae bacterium]